MKELVPIAREEVASELVRMASEVHSELGFPPEFDTVTANEDLVYAHFPQIGCAGVVLQRATGRVHVLGSGNPAEAYIWAYYRGFDLDGDNRLVINAVHDLEETIQVLKRAFRAPFLRTELAPQLAMPPVAVKLEPFGFYCMLGALRATGAFEFEANRNE